MRPRERDRERENSHAEPPIQDPNKRHNPALRRVAPNPVPAQHHVQPEAHARDQGREEHEDERGDVVQRLQGRDLGGDLERLELGESAGARGAATSGHGFVCALLVFGWFAPFFLSFWSVAQAREDWRWTTAIDKVCRDRTERRKNEDEKEGLS